MDHAGAVVGPLAATAFLFFYPGDYRTLFALTIVPGAIAVAIAVPGEGRRPVDERPAEAGHYERRRRSVRLQPDATGAASSRFRAAFKQFMLVLMLFTLGQLHRRVPVAQADRRRRRRAVRAAHVVGAARREGGRVGLGGAWSDRIGRRAVIAIGWIIYAVVYAGFAVSTSLAALLPLFLVYGLYFGFAEGTEKALVADLAPASRRGFAFGIYNAVLGLGQLAASVLFGLLWTAFGPAAAFAAGAALALISTALLFVVVPGHYRRVAQSTS